MTDKEIGDYVHALVADAIDLGLVMANNSLQPQQDELRTKNIETWSRNLGITPKIVRELEKKHLIKERKITDSVNAAKYYSMVEIKQALLMEHARTGYGGRFSRLTFTNQ